MRLTFFVLSSIFFALNASTTEGHKQKRRSKKTIGNRILEEHSLNQLELVRSGSGNSKKEKKSLDAYHKSNQNNDLGKGDIIFKKILIKHSEIPHQLNNKSVEDSYAINNIEKHGNIPEFSVSNDSISKKDSNQSFVANNFNRDKENEIKTKSLVQLQNNKTSQLYQTSSGYGLFNLKETNQEQVHKELKETSEEMQNGHEGMLHERVSNNTENYHHKSEALLNENTIKPANNQQNSRKHFKAGTLIISDDSAFVAQQPKIQKLGASVPTLHAHLKNQTKNGSGPASNKSLPSAGKKSKNNTQRIGVDETQQLNESKFYIKTSLIPNQLPANKVTINTEAKTHKTDENINGATGDELLQNIGFKKAIFLKDKVILVRNKTEKASKKKKHFETQRLKRVRKIRKSFGKSDEKKDTSLNEHLDVGHLAEKDLDDGEAADRKYFSGTSITGSSLFSKVGLKPQFISEKEGLEEEGDETERMLFSPKKPEGDEDSEDYDQENEHASNKKEYSGLSHNNEQYNNLREHSNHEKDDDDKTENQEHKTHGFRPITTEKLLLHKNKFHSPNDERENLVDENPEENFEPKDEYLKSSNYLDNKQLHDDKKDENEEYNSGFHDHNNRFHYHNNRKSNQHNPFHDHNSGSYDHNGANDHNNVFHHNSKQRNQARREDSAEFDPNDDLDVWKNIVRMNSDVEPSNGLETSDNTLVDSEESDAAALLPTDPKILAGFGVNDQRFGETWFEAQKNIERDTTKVKHHDFSSKKRFKDEDSKDIHELESFVEPNNDDDVRTNKKPKRKSHKKKLNLTKDKNQKIMAATLFNQPHERNMLLPEEIPLSKIEDQNNESIMKIICKKAKCDEYRRYNKNFDEDDGAQLRKYMQEGDEIVAQIGVGSENDAESFMVSEKKMTDDLFSHTHIESQMNPSYAKVIPLSNSDTAKLPTPAFSPDIVAQATKLDTPGFPSPNRPFTVNGNNKALVIGEKVSLLLKAPNETNKNIFEEGVSRKITSKTDDFSSYLGNNKSELDQNEGVRGIEGHHEPSKSLFEAIKIISRDPLLKVSRLKIAKSKLNFAKPIQVAVHQTEQNCDCQLFIKIIKTPGCMEICKAKVLYEEQLRQLKNHSIGVTTEIDNKVSPLLYDEASGDTTTPDQLLYRKDLSNGSLPEQNLTFNTDQSSNKLLDIKMAAINSKPNIPITFQNLSSAKNNSYLSLNKKNGENFTMGKPLTETNDALSLENKFNEQEVAIGSKSNNKIDPKTSSRSYKLKSVKNMNKDRHDLDSLTEVLLKPTLLETSHRGTNHREKVILVTENKIPLISSSLSPLEIVNHAKRLLPYHIDADSSPDIVQELLKNSHPIIPSAEKAHFNIHSLNKILHSSGPVIIENGDSNILEEDDYKNSPEIIKEVNDEGGKEEDLVYDDDEDADEHNDDQDDDDEKEYLSNDRGRPLRGIDVSLLHTNYAEEHGSVKTIISNDESTNEDQNKEENDKLIGYNHHNFEGGSNHWLPEVIHHERNSSTQFQCVNGGVSVPVSKFDTQCMCPHQFYGKTCKDWNFCYPNPCSNGGQCQMISEIPKFKCHCKKAYIGHTCSEFNPCDPNPCNNHGICSHDGKTATCTCTSRFKGENCAELSNCYPNPCKNNGRCVDMEGRFKCECQNGFIGKICEENDICATNICQNGGQCIVNGTSFACQCAQGFVGKICQDRVCLPNPCHHGGICIQRENSMYACLCPSWAAGVTCEDVSPCRMNPCKNGARCIDAMSGFRWTLKPMQYFCDCKPPFKGAHCEKNACSECHVDASCDADRCVCNFGFYGDGKTCYRKNHSEVIEVKPCQPNPCMNDGECLVKPGLLYECQCKAPFVPPNCAETDPCKPNPCGIHEKCEFKNSIITCNCAGNLREKNCGDNLCRLNACYNRGVCTPAGENAFMCSCEGKWGGSRCRECNCPKSQSNNNPSSWCDAKGQCQCPAGFLFDESKNMCTKNKGLLMKHYKACQSSPCMNSIVCLNDDDGIYTCICLPDWYGKNCQYRRKCLANPCYNGGTCMEKDGVFLGCVCLPEYLPPLCRTEAPTACHPSPCQNNAVCTPHSSGGYDCICPQRYTGPHCTIDRCRDCDVHAFCANGKCICNDGYVGSGYECVSKGCPTQCLHFQTCIENQCRCIPGHREIANICIPVTELQMSEDGMVKPTSSSADLLLKTTLSQFLITKNTRHAAFFPTKLNIMTSPTGNTPKNDYHEPSSQSGTKVHTIQKAVTIPKRVMRPPGNPTPTSTPFQNNAEESRRKKNKKHKSHTQVLNKFRALFQSQDAKTSSEAKKQEMLLSALLDMPSLMIQEIADLNERNFHVSNGISKTSNTSNSSINNTLSKSSPSEILVMSPKIPDLLTLKESKNNSLTVKNRKEFFFGNFNLINILLQKNSSNLDSALNKNKTSIQHIKSNITNALKKLGSNIITSNGKNMFQNNDINDKVTLYASVSPNDEKTIILDKEDTKTNGIQKGVETNGLLDTDTKNKGLPDKKGGATADSITASAANASSIPSLYLNNTTPINSNDGPNTGISTETKIPQNLTRKILTENCIIDPGCVERFINISKLKEPEDKNDQMPFTGIKNDGEDLEELGLKKPNKHMHFLKSNEDLFKPSGFERVHNVLEKNNDVLQPTYFKMNEETRPKIKQSADKAGKINEYKHGKFQDGEDKNLIKFLSLVEKRLKFKPFHKTHASQPIIPPWMKIETEEKPKIVFLAGTDTNITEMRGILKHQILKYNQHKSLENPSDLKDFLPFFDILSLKSSEKRKNLQNKSLGVPHQSSSHRHNFNKNYQRYEQSNSNYEEDENSYNEIKKHKKKKKKKFKTYQIYL